MQRQRIPSRARVAVLAVALGLLVACAAFVPRQGWAPGRGPVVPHDTFPADCSLCHLGDGWHLIREEFQFDHGAETGIVLTGRHAQAECLLCHNDRGPVAQFSARGCGGCHEDPHRGELGAQCTSCHDEQSWRVVATIAMHDRTRFPLIGAHAAAACWRCHPGATVGNFAGAPQLCDGCHQSDLARATAPDHRAQGWIDRCDRCHRPTHWNSIGFPHPQSFPLSGGHGGLRCETCHAGGIFTRLPTDCASCHADEWTQTSEPGHQAAGFDQRCESCHAITTWRSSFWPHPGALPLTGGHAGRRCSECHAGGVYRGTPTDCYACHQDDYERTTNPNHRTSNFPTTCTSCHSTTTWRGAVFNHRFPISGPHRVTCAECHIVPNDPRAYSCTHCHDHSQSRMADKHKEVSNYSWSSPACLGCHPNGRG